MKPTLQSGMTMMMIVVEVLIAGGPEAAVSQTIFSIGSEEDNVTDEGSDPTAIPLAGNVFLLSKEVPSPGTLFAFSVYFRTPNPVILQVYRSTSPASRSYRLIAEFNVTPSVPKGREDIYIESLLNRPCIAVNKGDRLGVYVPSDPTSFQVKFDPNVKPSMYKVTRRPLLGDTIDGPTEYPLSFRAKAFVVANDSSSSSSSSVETGCIFGLTIPGAFGGAAITTTTTMPITGAVGATGATGPMGSTGSTGATGPPGIKGADGHTGWTGNTGPIGLNGPLGATGVTGARGQPGLQGATGSTGVSERGDPGVAGLKGPLGEMGRNETIFLNQRLPPQQGESNEFLSDSTDQFWSSSKAIWATYIWLAIVSLLLVLVIIFIIVIMTVHSSISRSVRSSPKSAHSRSNILDEINRDETPSTYSDIVLK